MNLRAGWAGMLRVLSSPWTMFELISRLRPEWEGQAYDAEEQNEIASEQRTTELSKDLVEFEIELFRES